MDKEQTAFCGEVLGSYKEEEQVLERLYSLIVSANFSREVLAQRPDDLSVLTVNAVGWTDVGEPQRVVSTLQSDQFYHRTAGLCSPAT